MSAAFSPRPPLQEIVENGSLCSVPDEYIIPEQDRPRRCKDAVGLPELPVIDMAGVQEGGERRRVVVELIRHACLEWGFFQVVNHGVPQPLMKRMQRVARDFFELPLEEKQKYSVKTEDQTLGSQGYGSKFKASTSGTASDWGDQLRHRTLPVSARQYELWPTNPPNYRVIEEEYVQELDRLTKLMYELLSEGLGLHPSYLSDFFHEKDQQVMLVNYYPPCPQPELTMGIQKHSDIGLVTVLWQDSTSGLEISKGGNWIPVKPIEDAFVINMADQMEILTNGKYQSVEHRGLVNSSKPRMSIANFTSPRDNVLTAPIPALLDDTIIPQYAQVAYGTYKTAFFAQGCAGKELLKTVAVKY